MTDRGRAISRVAADPRLARALLDGASVVGARRAAEVVALLSEDVRSPGGDLVAALRTVRRGGPAAAGWPSSVQQLRAALPAAVREHDGERGLPDDLAVGLVVALAHPGRVARQRPGSTAYLMASGTGAVFGAGRLRPVRHDLAGRRRRGPSPRDARRDHPVRGADRRGPRSRGGGRPLARGGAGRVGRRPGRRPAQHPARRDRARLRADRVARTRAGRRGRARGAAGRGPRGAALDRGGHVAARPDGLPPRGAGRPVARRVRRRARRRRPSRGSAPS